MSTNNIKEQQEAPEDLTPMAFKIYVYLLKRNPKYVHLSQITHDFHISPQLTNYYVQKLVKLDYIEHQEQTKDKTWEEIGYRVKKIVPIAPLKNYLFIAQRFLIPRQAIYIMVCMILLMVSWLTEIPRIIQAITLIPLILSLYDLYRQKRKL